MSKQATMTREQYLLASGWRCVCPHLTVNWICQITGAHHDSTESAERAQLAKDASLRDYREQRWAELSWEKVNGPMTGEWGAAALPGDESAVASSPAKRERVRGDGLKASLDAVAQAPHPHWPKADAKLCCEAKAKARADLDAVAAALLPDFPDGWVYTPETLVRAADTIRAERDSYKRDFDNELAGNCAMRERLGARDDETFHQFVERLAKRAALADEILAAVERNGAGKRCEGGGE